MTFKFKITIILTLLSAPLFSQRFSLEPGAGIGYVPELQNRAGKGMLFLCGHYNLKDNYIQGWK